MKAIVYYKYGSPDVLKLEEVEKPTPADNQLLIKVQAVSVNRSDWEGLIGKPLYARIGGVIKTGNKILGFYIAGTDEAGGKDVKQVKPRGEGFGLIFNFGGGFAEDGCKFEKGMGL